MGGSGGGAPRAGRPLDALDGGRCTQPCACGEEAFQGILPHDRGLSLVALVLLGRNMPVLPGTDFGLGRRSFGGGLLLSASLC